jgi:alpha-glucoside transport system substrate-binding protein
MRSSDPHEWTRLEAASRVSVGWRVSAGLVVLVIAGLLVTACGTASTPGQAAKKSTPTDVRVLGSWTGNERDAFEAVVRPFEQQHGVNVRYSSTRDLEGVIARGIATADPPDIAGLAGPAHMRALAKAGALRDLTAVIDIGRYRQRVAPTFIDLGTVDGHLVGVFARSSLKGLIWYDPAVFRLGTPTTWDELQRMASQAALGGTAEWCVGLASRESSGWPGTDLVEQFLLRTAGSDAYDEWVAGRLPWTSPAVRRAFELYGQVVAEGSVYGGTETALRTDFGAAGDPLFSDPPGCIFMAQGSFMPAFFAEHGRQPGIDYDFIPFPRLERSEPAMIGGGDLFGLLTDDPAAADLLRYLVSDEAQTAWVAQGGSLSVDATVVDYPDEVTRKAAALLSSAERFRFDGSDLMPAQMASAFNAAILDVSADPSSLDRVLDDLDSVRSSAFGG